MRTYMHQWFVLAMGVLAIAGCPEDQSAAGEITPIPPAQPFVFYDETGAPSEQTPALSEVELREIIDSVASQTSDPVWLIHVHPAPEFGLPPLRTRERGRVEVYLVPDRTTPRLRTGRYYLLPEAETRATDHPPSTYAQVSMPNRSFTGQLAKPSAAELPFYWPANPASDDSVSQEELTAIVDFVRRPSNYEGLAGRGEMSHDDMVRMIIESPIQHMFREGDEVGVHFGFQHAGLWGYGLAVVLKCSPTGYKVVGWGRWMS